MSGKEIDIIVGQLGRIESKLDKLFAGEAPHCKAMTDRIEALESCDTTSSGIPTLDLMHGKAKGTLAILCLVLLVLAGAVGTGGGIAWKALKRVDALERKVVDNGPARVASFRDR
jgi:hypothetical protein